MIMKSMMKKAKILSDSTKDQIGIYTKHKKQVKEMIKKIDTEFTTAIDQRITEMKKH